MIRCLSVLSCLAALGLWAAATDAGDKAQSPAVEKAQKLLMEHLGDKAKGGTIVHLAAPALNKSFPDHEFFALRFRIYPVARIMPAGMKPSNVFAVAKEGKIQHLKDAKILEAFFRQQGAAATSEASAGAVAQAWLWVAQEFVQDGFYKFKVGKAEVKSADGKVMSASDNAVVMAGGNGEMRVTLNFDDAGKVDKVAHTQKIRPGPRPICQATKLLDPDPIVRRMAEQDLVYMGLAARDYLMEQRAGASPELRQAIDRLWQRIQKEGW